MANKSFSKTDTKIHYNSQNEVTLNNIGAHITKCILYCHGPLSQKYNSVLEFRRIFIRDNIHVAMASICFCAYALQN